MTEIDKHPKFGIDKEDERDLSRRGIIGRALLILGGTAASTVATGTAIAKTADVSIDSLGRPMIEGKPLEGEQLAARPTTTNNCRCTNTRCVRAQRARA